MNPLWISPSHAVPPAWRLRRGRDTATHFEIAQSSQRQLRVKNRSTRNLLIAKVHMAPEVQSVENEQEKCPVDKSLCHPRGRSGSGYNYKPRISPPVVGSAIEMLNRARQGTHRANQNGLRLGRIRRK